MRSLVIPLLLVSGWANALTLSPMRHDELIYQNNYVANFKLENTTNHVMYYDVWVSQDVDKLSPEEGLYKGEIAVGGMSYSSVNAPIYQIKPNELGVYWVCVQEQPMKGEVGVVGKVCAKLRVYWPLQELSTLR